MSRLFPFLLLTPLHKEAIGFRFINESDFFDVSSSPERAYFYIFIVLFLSNMIHYVLNYFKVTIPGVTFLIILGILWGIGATYDTFLKEHLSFITIPPDHFMDFFLPMMMFKTTFFINYELFYKALPQIAIISFLVFTCSILFLGFLMSQLIQQHWSIRLSILFGTLCLPIYPIAMVANLKRIGVHTKDIRILLTGEATITLAISSLIYLIIVYPDHPHYSQIAYIKSVINVFVKTILIQPAIGLVTGVFGNLFVKFCGDDVANITIFTIALPLLTYSGLTYFKITGAITIFTMGTVMGSYRASLPVKVNEFLTSVWEAFIYGLCDLTYVTAGIFFATYALKAMDQTDYIWIFVTYIMANVSRFVSFLIFLPLLSRIGNGLTFHRMLIIVWGGVKNPLLLSMTMALRKCDQVDFDTGSLFLIHIVGLFLFELIINGTTTPFILKVMGVTEISLTRQINMNNCMKIILAKRERAITILKMDRLLSDANWLVVNTSTELAHPYALNTTIDETHVSLGMKFAYCPDCKKPVQDELTTKEFNEMITEAEMRCARAKKISYTRQYETGLLSKNAFAGLIQSVEAAMTSKDPNEEVEGIKKYFKEYRGLNKFLNKNVQNLFAKSREVALAPVKPCRRFCYNIAMSRYFMIFIYVTIGVNFIESAVETWVPTEKIMFCVFDTVICFIYLGEFVIKVLGYSRVYIIHHGLHTYFSSIWNVFDFMVMIFCFIDLILGYLDTFYPHAVTKGDYFAHIALRMTIVLRYLQLVKYLRIVCPRLIKYIDTKIDKHLVLAYEVGQGFVKGEDEVLKMLPYMINHDKIKDEMQQRLQNNRLAVMRKMNHCVKGKPWITAIVNTKQASTTVLNSLSNNIKKLQSSGWIEDVEAKKLIKSLDHCYRTTTATTFVNGGRPREIFDEIPFLNNQTISDYLYSNIITRSYVPGEVIVKEGHFLDGIYIVMTGFLLQTYKPNRKYLKSLDESGVLPVIDYPILSTFTESFSDFIMQGNCFGELGVLTGRPYSCKIVADMYCRLYIIQKNFIIEAFQMDDDPIKGLKSRIWRSFSIRIAVPILLNVGAYKSSDSMTIIKKALERSFVPDLMNFKTFTVTNKIEDLILIEGMIADFNTKIIYTGPCYIPRAVLKVVLTFYDRVDVKILVIPKKDADAYDIMIEEEAICELADSSLTKCYSKSIKEFAIMNRKKHMHFGQTAREAKHTAFSSRSNSIYAGTTSSSENTTNVEKVSTESKTK